MQGRRKITAQAQWPASGEVIAANGGINFTGSTTSPVDGFLEAISVTFSGSGTAFTGSGPSPEPITETVTVPDDVTVARFDW